MDSRKCLKSLCFTTQHHLSTCLLRKLHHLILFFFHQHFTNISTISTNNSFIFFFSLSPSQQKKADCFASNALLKCDIVDWDENVVDDTSSVFQLTNAAVKYNCLIGLWNYMYEGAPVLNQKRGEVAWFWVLASWTESDHVTLY